jgi:TP901 family phage tail tape measure protein
MADNAKFIIETVANLAGIQQATQAMDKAEKQSRRLAQGLSATSRFMGATVTKAYNQAGHSFEKTTATFQDGSKKIQVVSGKVGQTAGLMSQSIQGIGRSAKGAIPFLADFQKALARVLVVVPVWLLFRSIFMGVIRLVKSSFAFLKNWEYQMAQIGIVVNKTASELSNLSAELITLSRTLGVSNKSLGEGAKLYAQQGRAIKEILPLMDATAKLSLLTGRSITQSVEDLTAVLKAYNIEARDAITVVDGITNVMLNNAITAGDLAQAYKQVASTASTFGVSLNALTGYITAVKTVTRDSGSKIGLTFRTLFTRLTTVSAKAIQDLTQIPLFLDETGKATSTVTPNLRNLETVLSELSSSFERLGSAQQSQLAKLLGGVRRTNQVIALFRNFDQATKANVDSLFNFGKGGTAVGILTETLELKVKRLSGTWNEFTNAVGNTQALKNFITGVTEAVQAFTFLTNPRQFKRITFLEELNKQQETFVRKINLADAFVEAERRALELQDSFEAGRVTSAEVEYEVGLWAVNLAKAGRELGVNFNGNLTTATGLTKELQERMDEISIAKANLEFASFRQNIHKDLVGVADEMRTVADPLFDSLERFDKQIKIIPKEELKNIKEAEKRIRSILDNLEADFGAVEMNELLESLKVLGITGENSGQQIFEKFKQLSNVFINSQKDLENYQDLVTNFIKDFGKQREEAKKARLVASETEATLLEKLFQIELSSIRLNQDGLEVAQEKLKLLKENENVDSDRLSQLRDNLEKEEARLKVAKERFAIELKSKSSLNQAKALGASELQLAIQEFAIAEATNAKYEERLKLQEKIVSLMKKEELGAQQAILEAVEAMRKASGEETSESLLRTRSIEEKLGLEQQGLDALKQQLEIAKAIVKEGGDVSKIKGVDQETKKLVALLQSKDLTDTQIANAIENVGKEFTQQAKRVDYKQFQASLKGLSSEQRVKAREARVRGERLTPTRLDSELSKLGGSVQEGAKQGIIAGLKAVQGGAVGDLTAPQQKVSPITQTQVPIVSRGAQTFPSATGKLVEINIGDTKLYLNTGLNDQQILSTIDSEFDKLSQQQKNRLLAEVAKQLRTPGSAIRKASDEGIENF